MPPRPSFLFATALMGLVLAACGASDNRSASKTPSPPSGEPASKRVPPAAPPVAVLSTVAPPEPSGGDAVRCPAQLPSSPPPQARLLGAETGTGLTLAAGRITTLRPAELTLADMDVDAVTYDTDDVVDDVREYRIEVSPTAREPYTLACGYGARPDTEELVAWLLLPVPSGRRWQCAIRWQWNPPRPGVAEAPTTAACV